MKNRFTRTRHACAMAIALWAAAAAGAASPVTPGEALTLTRAVELAYMEIGRASCRERV